MIVHVAYYDPATGAILQTSSAEMASLQADGRPFVVLDAKPQIGFDRLNKVVGGKVVALSQPIAPAAPSQDAFDAPAELTGSQTGPLEVTLTWRNPRSPRFDHTTIFRNGVEDSAPIVGGMGAPMTVMTNPPATGSLVYFLRAYSVDGGTFADSDPITVLVS